jgi:hypothetical protein
MNLMYGFCDADSLAALREYHQWPQDWEQHSDMSEMAHSNLTESVTLMLHAYTSHGK